MISVNLKKDISALTNIDFETIDKINKLIELTIYQSVHECKSKKDKSVKIDLGFGEITIIFYDDQDYIKYKFTPNELFSKNIKNAFIARDGIVKLSIDTKIRDRINSVYKEII